MYTDVPNNISRTNQTKRKKNKKTKNYPWKQTTKISTIVINGKCNPCKWIGINPLPSRVETSQIVLNRAELPNENKTSSRSTHTKKKPINVCTLYNITVTKVKFSNCHSNTGINRKKLPFANKWKFSGIRQKISDRQVKCLIRLSGSVDFVPFKMFAILFCFCLFIFISFINERISPLSSIV